MTTSVRVKSVFEILEAVEMPKELRYRMKKAARSAIEGGANFGGVIVTNQKTPCDLSKSTGVLHVWRVSETGEIIPLTITMTYAERQDDK